MNSIQIGDIVRNINDSLVYLVIGYDEREDRYLIGGDWWEGYLVNSNFVVEV